MRPLVSSIGSADRSRVGRLEAPTPAHAALAETKRLGSDLEQLVLANPLQTLLEIHDPRGRDLRRLVGGRRAHVRELLFLGDVHVEVVVALVLVDDLPLLDHEAGAGENHPARQLSHYRWILNSGGADII